MKRKRSASKSSRFTTKRPGGRRLRLCGDTVGQSLAEFALAAPVLLLLFVGMVEFARGWMVKQVITNVAREGARLAVLPGSNQGQVQARVDSLLTAAGISTSAASVSLNLCSGIGCAGTTDEVRIEVPYQFALLGPVMSAVCQSGCGSGLGTVTLSSTSRMRNE